MIFQMNDKNELIVKLAESIKRHREIENEQHFTNSAVGLASVKYFDQDIKIWITNKENKSGIDINNENLSGRPIVHQGIKDTLTTDGQPVYKNTKVGECLIKHSEGQHEIQTPSGAQLLTIYNTTFYTPHKHQPEAQDIRMNIGELRPRFFRSLQEILGEIRSSTEEISKIEEALSKDIDTEALGLLSRLEELNKLRNEALAKAKSFIRKGYELRYQPILDPWQEEVKRSNLFNASMAINGGPGTGKTTSLIQRIKFLTDEEALKEYLPNLTRDQREKLFSRENGWVFYTPGELLKLFLKNSMVSEGLLADDNHVKIWISEKEMLLKRYKLINSETQRPFLIYRKKNTGNLLPFDSKNLKKILEAFDKYFLEFQNEKLNRISALDISLFIWKSEGQSIINYINRQEKDYSFDGLIRLYFNIQEQYSESISKNYSLLAELTRDLMGSILNKIEQNTDTSKDIFSLINKWLDENRDEEDEELEQISDDEELENENTNLEIFLMSKLRILIKKIGIQKYDKKVKLSIRENELKILVDKISNGLTDDAIDRIGQYTYFVRYFGRLTRGPVVNLFLEIPSLYKKFRRAELNDRKHLWNWSILEDIIRKDDQPNKRLHQDEQAFLISFINGMVQKCYNVSKLKTKNITHPYFLAYNTSSHCVIGVDESTDFHLIDLLAINSLSDFELSSVTFSGDIMQRLTSDGIRDWNELKPFMKQFIIKELLVSYRQSPTLLEIASSIYNHTTGKQADYISCMEKDELEPKPLFYYSLDECDKIEWISKRILEIYKAYGDNIPSVAIFLSDENLIEQFASQLGEIDRLADVGITVKACNKGQVLGDSNMIRVFSIEYIKGLEFEAVFYHNLESTSQTNNEEITAKNMYVGLSRASFYMGVTSTSSIDQFTYLQEFFNHNQIDWK
jgi:hypothetical protein